MRILGVDPDHVRASVYRELLGAYPLKACTCARVPKDLDPFGYGIGKDVALLGAEVCPWKVGYLTYPDHAMVFIDDFPKDRIPHNKTSAYRERLEVRERQVVHVFALTGLFNRLDQVPTYTTIFYDGNKACP